MLGRMRSSVCSSVRDIAAAPSAVSATEPPWWCPRGIGT